MNEQQSLFDQVAQEEREAGYAREPLDWPFNRMRRPCPACGASVSRIEAEIEADDWYHCSYCCTGCETPLHVDLAPGCTYDPHTIDFGAMESGTWTWALIDKDDEHE